MKKKSKKTIKKLFELLVILPIIFYLFYLYQNIEINTEYESKKTSLSTTNEQIVDNPSTNTTNIVEIIEIISKSVCGISKLSSTGNSILSNLSSSDLGLGTGIIITENGYILSNSHVTGEKYSTCYITIEDKETYTGNVVWADNELDLSIIKINAKNLTAATLGNSKNIHVGENVYAIGNPIGYEFRQTVTSGIISATNRTIKLDEENQTTYMSNLIQTDATINPGNSGGPLINTSGEIIGVNSVKITSAEGIGFAIPINVIKPVIESFKNTNKFDEATLGLYVYDQSVAQYLKLESKYSSGIYISQIITNGPSYNKDLKEGDIITKIDDVYLSTINDLKEYLFSKSPGDTVTLYIYRGKNSKEIPITLRKK